MRSWLRSDGRPLPCEPLDQWGNPQSKTIAFMRQYTTEVVSRYKDSPAIWDDAAWTVDSRAEWTSIFLNDNAAMAALSAHLYFYSLEDEHQDSGLKGLVPAEQVAFMMDISRMCGKPRNWRRGPRRKIPAHARAGEGCPFQHDARVGRRDL